MKKMITIIFCCILICICIKRSITFAQEIEETESTTAEEKKEVGEVRPPQVEIPEVKIPEIKIPEIKIPKIEPPKIETTTPGYRKVEVKREVVSFVSLDESDGKKRKMTVKTSKGEDLQLELPPYVKAFRYIPFSEIKQDEKMLIDYRVSNDKNIGMAIEVSGPMPSFAGEDTTDETN